MPMLVQLQASRDEVPRLLATGTTGQRKFKLPTVTVILTSYNHEKFVAEAIKSVLTQSFTDFELVIYDDLSADGSWNIIRRFDDPRIRCIRNKTRRGPAYGINRGIAEAGSSAFIAIHHSDDVWEKDKLAQQIEVMHRLPECGAVFTNAAIITEDGSALNDPDHFYSRVFNQPNRDRRTWVRDLFYNGNVLCHPSALIRREVFSEVGPYAQVFAQLGDFEMWVRLCLRYDIHIIPEQLVRFRMLGGAANASGDRPETRVRAAYEMYRILERFSGIGSIQELTAIFPELQSYNSSDEGDFDFLFAMLLTKHAPYDFAPLLGLDRLTKIISDRAWVQKVAKSYGFQGADYLEATGTYDVFGRLQIEREAALRAELGTVKCEAVEREAGLRAEWTAELSAVKYEAEKREAALRAQAAAELSAIKTKARYDIAASRAQLTIATAATQREIALRARTESELQMALSNAKHSEQMNEVLARRTEEAEARLRAIDQSTMWRALFPVRAVLRHVPAGTRRFGRRALKVAWWTITLQLPKRMRERWGRG